jgi:hypothetical protein
MILQHPSPQRGVASNNEDHMSLCPAIEIYFDALGVAILGSKPFVYGFWVDLALWSGFLALRHVVDVLDSQEKLIKLSTTDDSNKLQKTFKVHESEVLFTQLRAGFENSM